MKNRKKIFQKLFRNVPWQPVHADIKDANLQIQVLNLDEMIADDNSETFEPHFPKYVKQEEERHVNEVYVPIGMFANRNISELKEMVKSKRKKTASLL